MKARYLLSGSWLVFAGTAAACEQPALVAIPANGERGMVAQIVEMQRYLTGIKEHVGCIQAELAAAGGDDAPESVRNVLISRNNAAVAEAEAVAKLFAERVAPMQELYLAEFVAAADPVECIDTARMESTVVLDDLAVLFVERGGRTHLNVLAAQCQDLERFGRFEVQRHFIASVNELGPVRTRRLCSGEFISPYAFDASPASRRQCALGAFFELTPEHAARIEELRPAARRAAVSTNDR